MAFQGFDILNDGLSNLLFGNATLVGIFITAFLVILLLSTKNFPEVALLIPFPLIMALAEGSFLPDYVKPLIIMVAGVYLALIILVMFNLAQRR